MVGLFAFLLAACTGDVAVYLTDLSAPETGGELELERITLPIASVEVRWDGDDEWIALAGGPNPYNLLDFSSEPTTLELLALRDARALLAQDELSLGTLAELRLRLVPDESPLVITADGVPHPVVVPASAEAALTLPCDVAIRAREPRDVLLDIDARDSVVRDEAGRWTLAPALTLAE